MTILERIAAGKWAPLVILALGAAGTARADYGELDINYPYTSLGSLGTPLAGVSGVLNGIGVVQLDGWSFPFGGQSFNEITVSSDGYLAVGNASAVCGCDASMVSLDTSCARCPATPPAAGPAQYACPPCDYTLTFEPPFEPGLIAPFWENFDTQSEQYVPPPTTANGTVSTLQGGAPGSQYLIVDYSQVGPYGPYDCEYNGLPPYYDTCQAAPVPKNFQVQLFESGAVVFTYGTLDSDVFLTNGQEVEDDNPFIVGVWAPPTFDGGLGWTDAGTMFGPSGTNGNAGCMVTAWEEYSNFSDFCYVESNAGSLGSAYIGELKAPFLTSSPVPTAQATPDGVVIDVALTVTNNGLSAQAANFPVDFFLVPQAEAPFSLPSTCSGQYCLAGPEDFGDSIPAGGQSTYTWATGFPLPSPLPPSGYYAITSVIDPTNTTVNATAPLLEIGTSTQVLPFGQDMTGSIGVSDFSSATPGEFTVPLTFTNLGLEPADSASYSVNFIDGVGDVIPAATGTVTDLPGLTSTDAGQDIEIPSGLDAGVYQLQLAIGPGSPTDLNMKNNTILGVQRVENGQDMTASIESVPFAIPSPAAVPTAFQVQVTFHNLGLQAASNIGWTMKLADATGKNSAEVAGSTISLGGLMVAKTTVSAALSLALPSGPYTLSLMLGSTSLSVPKTPDLNPANNTVIATTPIFVYGSGADYAVGSGDLQIIGSAHAADGQVVSVQRTIHNLEGAAGPCPYGYYLNPQTVTQIGNGVPVAIIGANGASYTGMTPAFAAFGQPGAQNTATDQLVIPPGIPAGTYNLVLALDPENQVADVDPSNNDTAIAVTLSANPLQITSPSSLPAAIVATPYLYGLSETGGGTQAAWSLLAGTPPNGISLDASGHLSGTPTEAGVFDIVVQVLSQGYTQTAVLQLPVASGSGALSIETSGNSLPTAIAGSPYEQQLEAQGGVPPYAWKTTLPSSFDNQLMLSSAGFLSGTPTESTEGPQAFTVVVTDSIGTQASTTLNLQVIAASGLTITTPFLMPAVVGEPYNQPIVASDGNLPNPIYTWSLPLTTVLPEGIKFEEIGSPAIAEFSGTPTQAGIFPVVLNVSDGIQGHTSARQYILTVTEAPVPVPPQTLPAGVVGQNYSADLQASSVSTVSWSIFSGELPPGLALAAVGTITGVPTAAGTYSFAAAVTDAEGNESVVPLDIQVTEPAPSSGGCATGGGPAGAALLLLAIAWLAARRRGLGEGNDP